ATSSVLFLGLSPPRENKAVSFFDTPRGSPPPEAPPLVPTVPRGNAVCDAPRRTPEVGPPEDAERPGRHSHAEHGNEIKSSAVFRLSRKPGGDRRGVSISLFRFTEKRRIPESCSSSRSRERTYAGFTTVVLGSRT